MNNARKAHLSDPRVCQLADRIIESQVREIAEMQLLLDDIAQHGEREEIEKQAASADLTPEMERQAREAIR